MFCSSILSGKECFIPEDWRFLDIKHPFSIIYYIIEGTAFYTMNGRTEKFKKGYLYIFPANKSFSVYKDGKEKMYHLFFHAFVYPELKELICLDVQKDEFLSLTIQSLRKFTTNDNSLLPTLYSRKLVEMLISYISEIYDDSKTPLPMKVKQYIDDNYISLFQNNTLGSVFGYSISQLNKIFRASYNITTTKYCYQLVIKHIIQLLKEGYSSKNIADQFNFSSPAAFCRFVKTQYGASPSQIKKDFLR